MWFERRWKGNISQTGLRTINLKNWKGLGIENIIYYKLKFGRLDVLHSESHWSDNLIRVVIFIYFFFLFSYQLNDDEHTNTRRILYYLSISVSFPLHSQKLFQNSSTGAHFQIRWLSCISVSLRYDQYLRIFIGFCESQNFTIKLEIIIRNW